MSQTTYEKKDGTLILLSAGGTGGHVMPAKALAHDLLSRGYRVQVLTDSRGMNYKSHFAGITMHELKAGTMGKGLVGKLRGLANMGLGTLKAHRLIKKLKPAVVVGFGGYPSVPGVYAAQSQKIPTILHEQNAVLGRANDYLAARAERLALSWPDSQGLNEEEWSRAVITGNPVRPEIADLYSRPYPKLEQDGPLRILVMGGSLGASVFSTVLPEALSRLSAPYRKRLHIVQQCREEDLSEVKNKYKSADIHAELSTFIDNVAHELEQCHLFIGRSGASTVAEMTVSGRPAIFVPLGIHKDNQQKMNADTVSDVGGAWTMTQDGFTPEALLARIETFMQDPSILFRAAEKARSCGKPDAARKLGNLVTAIASGWGE